jgi:hypothetical protein
MYYNKCAKGLVERRRFQRVFLGQGSPMKTVLVSQLFYVYGGQHGQTEATGAIGST